MSISLYVTLLFIELLLIFNLFNLFTLLFFFISLGLFFVINLIIIISYFIKHKNNIGFKDVEADKKNEVEKVDINPSTGRPYKRLTDIKFYHGDD